MELLSLRYATLCAAWLAVEVRADGNETLTAAQTREELAYPGVILLLGTAFIFIIWYMAMSHLKYVRDHTWSMLTLAVSIFCAVASNNFWNYIVAQVLNVDTSADPPTTKSIISSAMLVLVYWAVTVGLLYIFKTSKLRLKGYGTICGHILGFALITLWTQITQLDPFRTSAWWIVPVVFILYLLAMTLLLGVFKIAGQHISKGLKKDDADRWHEQSQDTGTDFCTLGMAFLLCTWIKFLIFGQLDPALADPVPGNPYTFTHIALLFTVGICLLFVGGVFTVLGHISSLPEIVMDVLTTVFSTTAAMCLIDVFNWKLLPTEPSEALGRMKVAFILSMIAVACVISLGCMTTCCLAKHMRALRGAYTGLGIAVGSSWEKTFDASVDSLDGFGVSSHQKAIIGYALFWIVFPAWLVYILPKGDDELRKEIKKPPPVWAFCCDCDPCAVYDSDDEDYEGAPSDEDS